jgi:hypothetical protein
LKKNYKGSGIDQDLLTKFVKILISESLQISFIKKKKKTQGMSLITEVIKIQKIK